MSLVRAACAAFVLLCVVPRAAAAQETGADRPADAAAIRAHIESIFQAFIAKDLQALADTHGAAWRGFTTGSTRVIRGRDGYMASAVGSARARAGEGMIGFEMHDFDVVFYGDDVGIASFVADVRHRYNGREGVSKLNIVDVYHRDKSGWIQVASQTSYHPDDIRAQRAQLATLPGAEKDRLFAAREAVWRAWYGGDTAALDTLLPPELVTLGPGDGAWGTRDAIIEASRQFGAGGAVLTRLAFPRSEVQVYGATAIIYTSYELDLTKDGQTRTERGQATEVFVLRNGAWLNTGWQLAPAR